VKRQAHVAWNRRAGGVLFVEAIAEARCGARARWRGRLDRGRYSDLAPTVGKEEAR